MKTEMTNFERTSIRGVHVAALLSALLLSACGGGGGSAGTVGGSTGTGTSTGGTGTTVTAAPTVTLAFTNVSGASTTALGSAAPLTVKATVLDAAKKPVAGAIVTFATDNTLATFSPSAGTALTDVNGVASVTMRAASAATGGAGTVTASSSVAGTTVTGTANYAVGATTLAFGTLSATPASLQAYGTTVLSVDVLSGTTKYLDQSVDVTFSSACVTAGKATLSSPVATNNGTAQTVYRDKGCGGNDTITVTADNVSKAAQATLTIAPPAAASVQFVGATPTDQSIVIQGQGGNGRTETATLTFKVVDIFGNPLAGKQVNFTTASTSVKVNKATDTTDATGTVITTVNSGSVPTSFRVQATLPGTGTNGGADISTLSDSLVVTTGLPVQRSFSISLGTINVEGWTIDSSPAKAATSVQVLLADAFGNPVPDGTPIVFQTNLGAIGSSSKGGCNTVNGGCSVDYRAQAPRSATANTPSTPCNTGAGSSPDVLRAGLATVCASSTDGTNTVFGKAALFLSGSTASNTTMNGSLVSFDALHPNDLGSVSTAVGEVFQLQLNDINQNPMPAGTTVAITGIQFANVVSVLPATVPNIVPHNASAVDDPSGNTVSGAQGSLHTFRIASTTPPPAACVAAVATFNVSVTTPGGSVTTIPFKLSFTCP